MSRMKADNMLYVYILESIYTPEKYYVGLTGNIVNRLAEHNCGESIHTNKYKPWRLKTYTVFSDHDKAHRFEEYLKSSSGRAFSKKRL